MSLMGTLAKVAIGVAVAKGVGGMLNQGGGSSGASARANDGGLFGGANRPAEPAQQGGLEDLMGSILGGKSGNAASGGGGGLGNILEQLGGGGQSGGLGDLIGGLTGGGQGGGGLGDLLGGLVGGAAQTRDSGGSFGDLLNDSLQRRGEPEAPPSADQEAAAGLMLRAMIQAAKSDGKIDEGERQKLLDNLGDVSPQEKEFVNHELSQPVDIDGLARQVPRGLEQQVYLMSVMGINLDNRAEAEYLHKLATAMNIGQREVNAIHDHLGVPPLYS